MIRRLLVWLPLPVILLAIIYTVIIGQVQTWVIIVVFASMLVSSFAIQSGRK
jgi:hypothetical protein